MSYQYSPQILSAFNQDLGILLTKTDSNRILVVSKNEEDFYKVLERQGKAKVKDVAEDNEIVVSKEAYKTTNISDKYRVKKILGSNRKDNSDRFYVLTRS